MKHLKLVALFLSIALSTQLKAEVINQHFNPDFGPVWYNSAPETNADGWSYLMLERETNTSNIYYGDASISLQTYNWDTDPEAYLVTPVKTGGAGWITFRYKTHSASSWNTGTITLEIQTSPDGETFSTVGTVTTLLQEAVWKRYSGVINDASAKYVRLLLKKGTATSTVDIDELAITDAVSVGAPPTIDAAITATIESEVGVPATIANAITLLGTDVTGDITLSFLTGAAFSVSPTTVSGSDVNAGKGLTVEFTPAVKNTTSDYLKITCNDLPELFVKVNGSGLLKDITEDFNTDMISYASGNFDYYGWTVSGDANYTTTQWGPNVDVYEGLGALNFTSLISPKKAGGIGTISFMYRGYGSYTPDFEVFVSSDKTNWTKAGNTTTTSGTWTQFMVTVNDPAAAYVKVATTSAAKMDADAFVITENGKIIASATGAAVTVSQIEAPYTFPVSVTFANVSGDVNLSINEPQLTLSKTVITQAEAAAGTVTFNVTYTPAEGKSFAAGIITLTGGGLPFPATVSVNAYLEVDQLFIDFESDWPTSTMNHIVEGWNVTNGSKNSGSVEYPNGALGSLASAYIQPNSSIISPPKSGGVGTVQFYAKVSWGTGTLGLSTSIDGTTWTDVPNASTIALIVDWQKFEYVINDATAKYIKITDSEGYIYVDNITVTKKDVGIAAYTLLNTPVFMTQSGQEQIVKLQLQGTNITSDMQVALKSGTAFTLENATIAKEDINEKTYELAVKFYAESGSYFTDELTLSGGGLLFSETIPLKGYILQDLIYQDFESEPVHNTADYSKVNFDGWEAYASTTYGANSYEGKGVSIELQPSPWSDNVSYLLTVPKSGGVGEIAFYYKNGTNTDFGYPVTFRIQTYKEQGGTPTVIVPDTILPPSASNDTPYQKFNRIVNDPDAKYVEVYCSKPGETVGTLRIDNFAVTAVGKRVPDATAPSAIRMAAYPGETDTYSFDLTAVGVDKEVRLSLKNGSSIRVDKTAITPVNNQVAETITLTYDDVTFSADTLVIESAALLKSLVIPVLATTYQEVLVQDFNKESWNMENEGADILDGWLITGGRNTWESYGETPLEGTKSLILTASLDVAGGIVSPAKAAGVNKLSFYWRPQAGNGAVTLYIQTSVDGETWQTVDELITEIITESSGYHLYEKTIADWDAQYVRLQAKKATYFRPSYLWVDSIAIDAMPYLRAEEVAPVNTTTVPVTIPVKVKGVLNSNASIGIAQYTNFSATLSKETITPEELASGNVVFDVVFSAEASGTYTAEIVIENADIETLTIPLVINYTKPYIELVGEVAPQTTSTGTATITVQVKGVLNTDAAITLAGGSEFTLSQTSITPAALADDATVSFDVAFATERPGSFTALLYITNKEIEPLFIPLSVETKGTGITTLSGNEVSVYTSESGLLNIVGAPVGSKVTVFDIQGKTVFSSTTKSDKEQYNVLSKGVYVVRVNDKTWKVLR